jgi:hypothetical protein
MQRARSVAASASTICSSSSSSGSCQHRHHMLVYEQQVTADFVRRNTAARMRHSVLQEFYKPLHTPQTQCSILVKAASRTLPGTANQHQ